MKKILLALTAVFALSSVQAQLADGSQAPDFTATDINGNEITLSTLLAEGKTVIIDFSATWCPPCWGYHNTHAMKDLHEAHGPEGSCSNDVVVIYVEGDLTTTSADLNGTGANTMGNWVEGTPYPIIDLTNSNAPNLANDYEIGYFPTIYKICPDGTTTEIGTASLAGFIDGIEECGFANDARIDAPSGLSCSNDVSPVVTLKNVSFSSMTSAAIEYSIDGGAAQTFNWSGSLNEGQSVDVELPTANLSSGEHTIEFSLTSPNGIEDGNGTNNCAASSFNVLSANGVPAPYAQTFSSNTFPYANWILNNPDGGITWARVSTGAGSLKYDCFTYSAAGQVDDFTVEPINLTAASTASVSFRVAHKRYSTAYLDALEVFVSSNCGETWESIWYKEGDELATGAASTSAFTPSSTDWRDECINIENYVGNDKVFVRFVGYNGYGNNIYVDNLNVTDAQCIVSVEENSIINEFKAFPNPTAGITNITYSMNSAAPVTFEVYDILGARVINQNLGVKAAGSYTQQVDFNVLPAGIYLVNLTADGVTSTLRITVQK